MGHLVVGRRHERHVLVGDLVVGDLVVGHVLVGHVLVGDLVVGRDDERCRDDRGLRDVLVGRCLVWSMGPVVPTTALDIG